MYEREYRTLSCKMFHNFNSFELKLKTVLRYVRFGNLSLSLFKKYVKQCSVQHQTSEHRMQSQRSVNQAYTISKKKAHQYSNICKKYAPEYKRDKTSSIEVHLKLDGKLRWPLVLKNKADSLTFLSLMAWFVSSACDFYLFPVILGHPRWPISKDGVGRSQSTNGWSQKFRPPGLGQWSKVPTAGRLVTSNPPPLPGLPPQQLNIDRCISTVIVN